MATTPILVIRLDFDSEDDAEKEPVILPFPPLSAPPDAMEDRESEIQPWVELLQKRIAVLEDAGESVSESPVCHVSDPNTIDRCGVSVCC